jgi:5-methylcytosine-specific restriction endonuclease McrA
MAESPSGECPGCGSNYQRLRQHWAMSDCGPDDGAKKTYTCDRDGCDETFEDYPTRLETRGRETFYCSKECLSLSQRNGEHRVCENCGDDVYVPNCHLEEGSSGYSIDHHFCDKECESEWKRANWIRQGHPRWQGGKGGIDAVRHALSERAWQDTAQQARENTGGVCENCGAEGGSRDLDVHHIVPVAAGGTNEPWNLMALCIGCHRRAEEYIRKYTEPHLLKFAE